MEETVGVTPPLTRRRFGTLLTPVNSPPRSLTVLRQARRVAPQQQQQQQQQEEPPPHQYTVTFDASVTTLGLQLEPCDNNHDKDNNSSLSSSSCSFFSFYCRVQGFADGGPQAPGAARSKGCIQPGDVLTVVNGHQISSYEQAIGLLRAACQQERVLVLQRPKQQQNQQAQENVTAVVPTTLKWPGLLQRWTTQPPNHDNAENVVNGTTTTTTTPRMKTTVVPPITTPQTRPKSKPTRSLPHNNVEQQRQEQEEDVTWMIQSADDLVLLSHNIHSQQQQQQHQSQRPRLPSYDSVSPRMTQTPSPNNNNNKENRSQRILSVEKMLLHDFGNKLSPRGGVSSQRTESQWHQSEATKNGKNWQDEKKQLLQQLNALQMETTRLNNQLMQAKRQTNDNDELESLRQQLVKRQQIVDTARLERDGALQMVQQKTLLATDLTRQLKEERDRVTNLSAQLDQAHSTLAKMEQAHSENNESLLCQQVKQSSMEIQQLQGQVKQEQMLAQSFQLDLDQAREQWRHDTARNKNQIANLESQLDQSKKAQHATTTTTTLQRSMEDKMSALQGMVSERDGEVSVLRNALYDEKLKVSDLETKCTSWKEQYDCLQASTKKQVTELQSRCEKYTNDIQVLDATCEKLKAHVQQKSQAHGEMSKRVETLQEQRAYMETKVTKLSTLVTHKEAELREAANTMELLETKLHDNNQDDVTCRFQLQAAKAQNDVTTARHEISQLGSLVDEYKVRLDRVTREKNDVVKSLAAKTDQVGLVQKKLEDTLSELSAKRVEIDTLQFSLKDATSQLFLQSDEVKELQITISRLESERDSLTQSAVTERDKSSQLSNELTEKLVNVQDELANMKNRNSNLDRILRSMRRNLSESERRATNLREQLETERRTLQDSQHKLFTTERDMQLSLETVSTDRNELREKIQQLEQERCALQQLVETTKQQSQEAEKQIQQQKLSYEENQSQWESARLSLLDQCSSQKKEILELSERLRKAKAESEELQREISSHRRQAATSIEVVKHEYETKCAMLEGRVKDKEEQLLSMDKLEGELRILGRELSCTKQSLRSSDEQCKMLTALLDEVREDCSCKIQEISDAHQSELQRAAENQHKMEGELHRTRTKLSSTELQLRSVEDALLVTKTDIEKIKSEKHKLVEKILLLEDELSEKSSELESLRSEIETGSEGQESPFKGLSSQDLREKCFNLSNEVHSANNRLRELETSLAEQQQRNSQLLSTRSELCEEMRKISGSLKRTQIELRDANQSKAATLALLESEKDTSNRLEGSLLTTRNKLAKSEGEVQRLSSEVVSLISKAEEISVTSNTASLSLKSQISVLETKLRETEQKCARSAQESQSHKSSLDSLKKQLAEIESVLSDVREEKESLKLKCQASRDEIATLSQTMSQTKGDLSEKLRVSETEIVSLKEKLSETHVTHDKLLSDFGRKSERLDILEKEIETATNALFDANHEKEEARSALTQAMQQLKSYKENIIELEAQNSELESTKKSLDSQMADLRKIMETHEETSDMTMRSKSKQLQEAEAKCSGLERERDELFQNLATARDELRDSRRHLAEQEGMLNSLRSRVANTAESLERVKTDNQRAKTERDKARETCGQLQQELANKTRQVDELTAKVQILDASATRMQSDYDLLQESSTKASSKTENTYDYRDDEIARLQSQLQSQESKLSSLSEVYKSQQQVLALSQSLEGQLVHFVEDVLHQASDSVFDIASNLSQLEKSYAEVAGQDNDSAIEGDDASIVANLFQSIVKNMSTTIPRAKEMLEEKHEQLSQWKHQRSLRVAPHSSFQTPNSKGRNTEGSPSVLEALEKVKQVLNDEVLTPYKNKTSRPQSVDAEYLQKVVQALESQIDSLLSDLQATNESLKAQQQSFLDLEELLALTESNRDELERKLKSTTESLRAAESKMQRLAESNSIGKASNNNPTCTNYKLLAAQMMAKFVEDRHLEQGAVVFGRWSSSCTGATKGATGRTIQALTMELEAMREKFMILKKHLKKSRRGKGQMQSGLDAILEDKLGEEGYDTM